MKRLPLFVSAIAIIAHAFSVQVAGCEGATLWKLLEAHEPDAFFSVAFSPDGKVLASGGMHAVYLWNVLSGREIGRLPIGSFCVAFSSDGKTLACLGSEDITLWDVAAQKKIGVMHLEPKPDESVSSIALSPDGKTLVSDGHEINAWSMNSRKRIATIKQWSPGSTTCVTYSPDGKTVASAENTLTTNEEAIIGLWDTTTWRRTASIKSHVHGLWTIAFSPDGKTLASCTYDGLVQLWNVASARNIAILKGHKRGFVYSVAFSPDGKTLASGSSDRTIRLWNVATHKSVAVLEGPSSLFKSVAFSPDGKTLASAGLKNGTVTLWDVRGKVSK
jgi:WD40 repeat protein